MANDMTQEALGTLANQAQDISERVRRILQEEYPEGVDGQSLVFGLQTIIAATGVDLVRQGFYDNTTEMREHITMTQEACMSATIDAVSYGTTKN